MQLRNRQELVAGAGIVVAKVGEWATTYDHSSGWVHVAAEATNDDEQVLIASDTILGLRSDALNSVWLHPTFEPSPPSYLT